MNALRIIILISSTSILLWSCTGNNSGDSIGDESGSADQVEQEAVGNTDLPENELADFKFHIFIANIPSPLESFEVLKTADIAFVDGLTNSIDNRSNYTTTTDVALNYGVYMADLGYFTFYEQSQQSMKYYATARLLAQDLGFAEVLDKVASSRFEDNAGNLDSGKVIIDDAYIAMDDYLKSNAQLKIAGYISLGGWMESQYLAISLMDGKDNSDFREKILEQKLHLDNLIKFFNEFSSDLEVGEILTNLNAVQEAFAAIVSVEDVNSESLGKVSKSITDLRDWIVN